MSAMLVLPAALTATIPEYRDRREGPSLCLILCCLWYHFYGIPPDVPQSWTALCLEFNPTIGFCCVSNAPTYAYIHQSTVDDGTPNHYSTWTSSHCNRCKQWDFNFFWGGLVAKRFARICPSVRGSTKTSNSHHITRAPPYDQVATLTTQSNQPANPCTARHGHSCIASCLRRAAKWGR